MYGKHFQSMYTGSMLGAGAGVFAVWGYVISHAVDSSVELNPKLLSHLLGMSCEDVEKAISYLSKPDQKSRNKEHDGKRLVKQGEYVYLVVSHSLYRGLKNEDERRMADRDRQRRHRILRDKRDDIGQTVTSASVSVSVSDSSLKESVRENFLPKIRAIGFRDSKAIAVEHALVDVCSEGAKPEDVYAALLRIYKWTGDGAYAPRLHEAIHRWQEPQHLWNPAPRKKPQHLETPTAEDYGETECPVCRKTPCSTFKDCQTEGKRRGWL